MSGSMRRLPCIGLLLSLAAFPSLETGAQTLLSDVSLHLEAARYQPTEPDLQWTGWIGAGAGLVRVAEVTGYFTAEVESILGHVRRPFEANQANYHLELGLRRPLGAFTAGVFFHHVSRHAVDRGKEQAVDWNVLGVRASGPVARGALLRLSAGHTTLASLVGYRWELAAGLDVDARGPSYVAADVRLVTVDPDPAFWRGNFVDLRAEAGARWPRGGAVLETFAAFERRNDVLLLVPATRDRLLLGFRIRYLGGG
jgi:hypothetical protein